MSVKVELVYLLDLLVKSSRQWSSTFIQRASRRISDKQFTSEMNNVHPTTRNTPVRSAYSTLFSTDTSFSSIRLSCHVISLPTCTIGADRPTRNNLTVSVNGVS